MNRDTPEMKLLKQQAKQAFKDIEGYVGVGLDLNGKPVVFVRDKTAADKVSAKADETGLRFKRSCQARLRPEAKGL